MVLGKVIISLLDRPGTYEILNPMAGIEESWQYDPNSLRSENILMFSKYSTFITNYEHEGMTLCLMLSFDILTE